MAGLPGSLAIAIWFVAALWGVGAVAYYFDYSAEFIWLTLFLGMGVALAEWRLTQNSDDA
jgi:hypothetical protein